MLKQIPSINLRNIILTKSQKKILAAVGIAAAAFFVFIAFIYNPQKAKLAGLKQELEKYRGEISAITAKAGFGKSMGESLSTLQEKLKEINSRFPDKEEIILRDLPKFSNERGVLILSLQPQVKAAAASVGGEAVSIKGYTVMSLPVSLNIRCPYKVLGEYLKALKEEFPFAVSINSLQMRKTADETADLDITTNLTFYLMVKEGA